MLGCVGSVSLNDSSCLAGCEGLIVSSYSKSVFNVSDISDFWFNVGDDYRNYKQQTSINCLQTDCNQLKCIYDLNININLFMIIFCCKGMHGKTAFL